MKAKELRAKTSAEIEAMLQEHRQRFAVLRAEVIEGKAKNVRELRFLRREIARLITLAHQAKAAPAPPRSAHPS